MANNKHVLRVEIVGLEKKLSFYRMGLSWYELRLSFLPDGLSFYEPDCNFTGLICVLMP